MTIPKKWPILGQKWPILSQKLAKYRCATNRNALFDNSTTILYAMPLQLSTKFAQTSWIGHSWLEEHFHKDWGNLIEPSKGIAYSYGGSNSKSDFLFIAHLYFANFWLKIDYFWPKIGHIFGIVIFLYFPEKIVKFSVFWKETVF